MSTSNEGLCEQKRGFVNTYLNDNSLQLQQLIVVIKNIRRSLCNNCIKVFSVTEVAPTSSKENRAVGNHLLHTLYNVC